MIRGLFRGWRFLLAGLAVAGLVLVAAERIDSREESLRLRELDRNTRIVARQSATRLIGALERHRIALRQMANFYENSDHVTAEEFQNFARLTQGLSPQLLRICFVDPRWQVSSAYPRRDEPGLKELDLKRHPDCLRAMQRARESRKVAVSPAIALPDGSPGFLMAIPVLKGRDFQGEVVGAFQSRDFFESTLLPEMLQSYDVEVRGSGTVLFERNEKGSPLPGLEASVEKFALGGNSWEATFRPRDSVVRAGLASGRRTYWGLSSLLALVSGGLAVFVFRAAARLKTRVRSQGETLRQTREKLEEAREQLHQAEKMRAMGELVAGVAHEINNPLASVMGYTQLLQARELPEEVKRRLELIHSEAARMARIVKNLLTFARKRPPEKKLLGLNGIVEKTLELKSYQLRMAQIRVEKDLSPDLPRTLLDFTQIQQVLLNLLTNAEQALQERPSERVIRIATRTREGGIELRVSDNGPGVPPELQSRLFEPFFTTKKEGQGTGLGLSLCYGIVQEHQGSIGVESLPGQGTTLLVRLPVVHPPGEEKPESTPAPSPGKRILLIDPEAGLVRFLVELLSSRGYQVDTAADLPEALRKLAAGGPDVIISDLTIPRGTGSLIRQAAAGKDPSLARRIIFTSGGADSEESLRLAREAGNQVILKPFRIEDVEKAIAGVLQN